MKYAIGIVTLIIALSFTSSTLAAEKYRWYIIKGKDGVCKVIQADTKTPATIAGPYKTKENAEAAKGEKCKANSRSEGTGHQPSVLT